MSANRRLPDPAIVTAMIGSAAVGAQYFSGKAARDALFLTYFDASALPTMIIATSLVSLGLVAASARWLKRVPASTWVPLACGSNAILLVLEWMLMPQAPGWAARLLYLQVSGLGPLLGSGFWQIASERFDPHTAKKRFAQIAAAGTVGGLVSGAVSIWLSGMFGAAVLLVLLSIISVACAWQTYLLGRSTTAAAAGRRSRVPKVVSESTSPRTTASGLRVLAETPYLRLLATLVFLATIAAIFVDQAFKYQVQATIGKGPALVSFLYRYQMAIAIVTFAVQALVSGKALDKFGLDVAAGTPAAAVLAGGSAALLAPGLWSVMATRATETILRGSVYRAGYELFFTPVSEQDRRAVKSTIDVGVDRMADMIGANLIQLLLPWIPRQALTAVLIGAGMTCSAAAVFIVIRLKQAYQRAVEERLVKLDFDVDLSEVQDLTTRTLILKTLPHLRNRPQPEPAPPLRTNPALAASDPVAQDILALNSRDRDAILRVLQNPHGLARPLVSYAVSLLARDDVAEECVRALRRIAEECVGELLDNLLDPNRPFVVRRRLARVFSVCVSQRAVDGLLLAAEDDLRFEVRFQCGRSLMAVLEKNPRVRIDKERVINLVKKEVSVTKKVWESRQLLDDVEDGDRRTFLEELLRDRASRSLAHVFTLLALVLPSEPLRIAFRGLHTDDQLLRGTALEYLEVVLPTEIRHLLWPFLEDRPRAARPPARRDDALEELLRSGDSILVNLETLKRREPTGSDTRISDQRPVRARAPQPAVERAPVPRPRDRRIWLAMAAAAALVLLRSIVFAFFEQNFDSDQAIVGLMAKHISEFHAFPMFFYGQNYMLGVEAWMAVPFFWVGGPTVTMLRLPLVLMNLAVVVLLIRLLVAGGVGPGWALFAVLPIASCGPVASGQLLTALGASVEPLLYVIVLWMLRNRPIAFGIVLCAGALHREFTMFALPAVLVLQWLELRRVSWPAIGKATAAFAASWVAIDLVKRFADMAGSAGETAAASGSIALEAVQVGRLVSFHPDLYFARLRLLFTQGLPDLFGARPLPLFTGGIWGDAIVGSWLAGAAVTAAIALAVARLLWLVGRRVPRGVEFQLFLLMVSLQALVAYGLHGGGEVEARTELNYVLLVLLFPVAVFGALFKLEAKRDYRLAVASLVAGWALLMLADTARVTREYLVNPPPSPHRMLADYLVDHHIKYASAGYWDSYRVTFLSRERVIVASTDIVRVPGYQARVALNRANAARIARLPCNEGTRVAEWCVADPFER